MSDFYIVTGGAGFIGSNLVAALNERGIDNILVVDRLGESEKWKNLVGLNYEDFLDKDEFRTAIHLGKLPVPKAIALMKGPGEDEKSKLNALLQQIAWDTVKAHPMTGIQP